VKRICIALDGPLRDPCHTSVQYIRIPPAMTMLTFDLPPLNGTTSRAIIWWCHNQRRYSGGLRTGTQRGRLTNGGDERLI